MSLKKKFTLKRNKPKPSKSNGSCRKLMRAIAHFNMAKNQIPNPNRKIGASRKSFFQRYWRDYVRV